MKYYITYAIDARCTVEVTANDLDTAILKANENMNRGEFGDMFELQYEEICIEDENENILRQA